MRIGQAGLAAGLVACGTETPPVEDRTAREPVAAPTSNYVTVEVVNGGTISGTVRYSGVVPAPRSFPVTDDAETCGPSQSIRSVVVGSRGGLADAVVSLVDIRRGEALAVPPPPVLDQRGCRFTPHVLLVPAGVPVRVLNNDPLTHNVHTAAFENRSVNRSQPAGLEVIELDFESAEKVKVKCDLHPWMSAWIVVTDHPYHAITDGAGAFELPNVPPGEYTLETWHESLGTIRQAVTILAGETLDLTVDLVAGD